MLAAVWNVPEWKPSKYDNSEIQRVVFKGLDDGKSYYLNLNTRFQKEIDRWSPHIKEGSVLDVQIRQGTTQVNMFGQFNIVKDITKV